MLKFQIPILPELKPTIDSLLCFDVTVYLHGKLGGNLLFIDIDWETARGLQHQLSGPWTLIYAYFVSSEAVSRGEPDPLSPTANLEEILLNYVPNGHQRQPSSNELEALIEQAEYLLQFPPSRLVYLGGDTVSVDALQQLKQLIKGLKN